MKSIGMKLSLLATALVVVGACTKKGDAPAGGGDQSKTASATELLIGEVGSMTGSQATFGTSTHMGVELAILEANSAGGVKGKTLKVLTVDNQGKPDEAATAVTKLITQNNVIAILGEVASSRSLAMAPIAQTHKTPMVTPSSTNPEVTAKGDYIFRVCFIDPFQGTVMAKFAKDNLKLKKVAVLRDVKSDYSVGLADYFIETFKKNGGEVVMDQSYSEGDVDFKAQLTAIKAKKPDGIFVPGYYTEVGLVARQARELGLKVPLMGGDGWDSPKLFEIGGAAMENTYFSNHYSSEDKSAHVQTFISKFKEKYGVIPDGLAAMGYDAAKVLIDAMGRAPSLEKSAIREALASTKEYQGVTGKITIDANRNAVKSAVVLKVEKTGDFKYVTTINP